MGKIKASRSSSKLLRHDPLHKQILADDYVGGEAALNAGPSRAAETRRAAKLALKDKAAVLAAAAAAVDEPEANEGDDAPTVLNAKMSRKILDIAQAQQREVDAEESVDGGARWVAGSKVAAGAAANAPPRKAAATLSSGAFGHAATFESDDEDGAAMGDEVESEAEWDGGNDDILDVDANELEALEKFFPAQPATRQSLADIISGKIAEYEAEAAERAANAAAAAAAITTAATGAAPAGEDLADFLNPKVVSVYTKVGKLLSRYKSGKLPKAFKIIPTLHHWEEVLYLTRPDTWTPHATFEATKIFVSSFNPKMAQRFLNVFVLEKVRDEVQGPSKKLSYHLYMALRKAMYKPAAFFKGIVLPMVESGCSLREAAIVGSVVAKVSVPALHSAACMMKLAEREHYNPAASLFLRVLLDKKYALPYKVVDSLVSHFLRFKHHDDAALGSLPVLWHQALLVFAQRYKSDMADEQRDALLDLIKKQTHYAISPEVRRELQSAAPRPLASGADVAMGEASAAPRPVLSGLAGMDVEMVDV